MTLTGLDCTTLISCHPWGWTGYPCTFPITRSPSKREKLKKSQWWKRTLACCGMIQWSDNNLGSAYLPYFRVVAVKYFVKLIVYSFLLVILPTEILYSLLSQLHLLWFLELNGWPQVNQCSPSLLFFKGSGQDINPQTKNASRLI